MEQPLASNRLPISMYCQLRAIVDFEKEKDEADRVLGEQSGGRNCVCILPVLEDGKHYYLQCNFKMEFTDSWSFKYVNTLDKLCEQSVFPLIDRKYEVEAYLFCTDEGRTEFHDALSTSILRVNSNFWARSLRRRMLSEASECIGCGRCLRAKRLIRLERGMLETLSLCTSYGQS